MYTNYKALEYFITTKDLTARQARWAEFFADFHFIIIYRIGITNTVADTLSRREQDITPLEARKRAIRSQQLLPNDKIDLYILGEVAVASFITCIHYNPIVQVVEKVELSPVTLVRREEDPDQPADPKPADEYLDDEAPDPTSAAAYDIEGYDIIDQVINANKNSPALEPLRERARDNHLDYELDHGKLYFQGRLEVSIEPPELRTSLIRYIHAQPSIAHAGISKVKMILSCKYHWQNIGNDVARYIANYSCTRMKARKGKTPGFLKPLEIPVRPY